MIENIPQHRRLSQNRGPRPAEVPPGPPVLQTVVRNPILLVDFIELRLSTGESLEKAGVDAGAVRFPPMMLTAAAVVVGSAVIRFDPIFRGLAISLMAGEVASLLLCDSDSGGSPPRR